MKKRFICLLLCTTLIMTLFQFTGATTINAVANDQEVFRPQEIVDYDIEQKTYCKTTLEDDFVSGSISVVLSKEATILSKVYTPEDFSEIDCIQVYDSTESLAKKVQKQITAQRTGDKDIRSIHYYYTGK